MAACASQLIPKGFEFLTWIIESVVAACDERTDEFGLSGCRDLNPGPLVPQTNALTKLRHSPSDCRLPPAEDRSDINVALSAA